MEDEQEWVVGNCDDDCDDDLDENDVDYFDYDNDDGHVKWLLGNCAVLSIVTQS